MPTKTLRGRPAFAPTATMRRTVATSAGGGMRHVDIAAALGITRETLRKYFAHELGQGASQKRMDVLNGLYRAAVKGSSAAARTYLAVAPEVEMTEGRPGTDVPVTKPAPAAPAEPAQVLGKKEKEQQAASTAAEGTAWAGLLDESATPLQ